VSDPREALLREGIAAFNRGDEEAVLAVLDPDVEVFTPPELGNAGTFHGHEGYTAWIESWLEAWDEFRIEPPRAPLPDARGRARRPHGLIRTCMCSSWKRSGMTTPRGPRHRPRR
jgi:hypothetical protein